MKVGQKDQRSSGEVRRISVRAECKDASQRGFASLSAGLILAQGCWLFQHAVEKSLLVAQPFQVIARTKREAVEAEANEELLHFPPKGGLLQDHNGMLCSSHSCRLTES